jgi:hypothetical protein
VGEIQSVLDRHVVVSMLSVFFASAVALYSRERTVVFFYVTAMFEVDRFLKGTVTEVFNREYVIHIKYQNLYL